MIGGSDEVVYHFNDYSKCEAETAPSQTTEETTTLESQQARKGCLYYSAACSAFVGATVVITLIVIAVRWFA